MEDIFNFIEVFFPPKFQHNESLHYLKNTLCTKPIDMDIFRNSTSPYQILFENLK